MPIPIGNGPDYYDPPDRGPRPNRSSYNPLEAVLRALKGGPFEALYGGGGPSTSFQNSGNGLAELLLGPMGIPASAINTPPQRVVPGTIFQKENAGQGMSPVQVALAQLDALVNQGAQMPPGPSQQDLQQALSEAAAGLRKQYGAEIGALQNQNQGARQDVAHGSAEVRDMYNALARSDNRMAQKQFKQGKNLGQQLRKMGRKEGQIITNQAKDINQAALEGAAGLGLADLGSDMVKSTNKRAQQLSSAAVQQGSRAAQTERKYAGNQRTYMQSLGQASRTEGTNIAADMYAQLQDYLQANRSQIAALAGERAAAIAQAKAEIEGSFAESQADYFGMQQEAQQALIDNKMELLKLALDIKADQRANRASSSPSTSAGERMEKFYDMLPDQMAGPSRLLSKMDDPTVTKLYRQLSGTTPMRYGYTGQKQDETDVPLVDNLANVQAFVRSRIGDEAWGSMSTAQRNALVSALLLQLEGLD